MKSIINIGMFLLFMLGFAGQAWAQIPEKLEKGTFALTNARLVTITDGVIENGTLVISDGKITALGTSVSVPEGASVIDCTGKSVYPGMIDMGTHLGLSEVGSVSLTQDYRENGNVKPQMQALTAVNPSSVEIAVTRVSGVTTAVTTPSGGLIPGTAALINLAGYTPNQMYGGFKAIVVNWPSSASRGRWDRRSDDDRKKQMEKLLKSMQELLDAAQLYSSIEKAGGTPEYNPQAEAMVAAVNGEMPMMIEVNRAADIKAAIEWAADKPYKVILTGVAEGWRVAEEIAAAGLPVITGPVLTTPTRQSDRYDRPYANPGLMAKAGVMVALRTNEIENVRNLPFNAGFAAAYGMGKEKALEAVTIVPAKMMGLEDRIGSLAVGKDASLFIANGDPFETKTKISDLFINGWRIPMVSRHTQLYDEFLDRAPGLNK